MNIVIFKIRTILCMCLAFTFFSLAFAPAFVAAAEKTVVFVAGRDSHGFGSHEHGGGCRYLAATLEKGLPGIKTRVHAGGWPKDSSIFDGADAVVLYMDGGGGHPVNRHLEEVDKLMKKGIGLACIHYAVEVPKGKSGNFFLDWTGGYFETHWSVNPHWIADFKKLPKHPITSGVKPFKINDEWYFHMRFRDKLEGVTPILSAVAPESTMRRRNGAHSGNAAVRASVAKGDLQHVAWARERPDGGRGFGFTGGHVHWNWGDENFRKLVLNAIAWVAKAEVPGAGVPSANPSKDELIATIKGKKVAKKAGKLAPGKPGVKPVFKSPVVTSRTPGCSIKVDVDIRGAKELYLVASDGGNGFSCDWADWGEPRLVGPKGEKKLTELKWSSASSGFGNVKVNANCNGQAMRMGGRDVPYGLGTHANSAIAYKLPPGYERFRARAGLDNGGTDQGACGHNSSVQFMVYTGNPGSAVLTSIGGGGGGGGGADSREPGDALAGLDVHADLDATLFASEPAIVSPTNLDIDHRGRIWICEVVNYRRNNGRRPEGDRIVILEDTNGDGVSDTSKVFYQGRDIDSAMGIVVLGNKVIVSCAPNVFVFHDDDGDDKSDRKEVLFTKTGQPQHDHSTHSIVFGPDGKFYWNVGNTGRHVHDAKGTIITDIDGKEVRDNGKPYFGGMVFRCNADGSEFEVLGHNFRNNYEATVDSLGAVWQSDNDDDGNRGVRINYVMEFGNYGYRDEMTGAGWRSNRVGIEKEIPRRHWHLNDPGVVPNLLQTGAGSPTGITVYEGRLLPRIFWDQVIHCDAGPNVCRAYPVKKSGAGYDAESVDILKGSRDRWFRPADVSVAPDGSLFVTDWYDPGVGGHGMRDLGRGRVFRVAPPGVKYKVPTFDFKTAEGAVEALKNPNYAARYLAWTALHDMGTKAEKALLSLYGSENVRHRARALWLLGKIEGRGAHYVELAAADKEEDIRVVAIRLARQLKQDIIPLVAKLASDSSAPVRRECALALRREKSDKAPALWAQLAAAHDGKDRWYLEALGISAANRWDEYFGAWLAKYSGKASSAAARNDVVWRSRASATPDQLAGILGGKLEKSEVPRYLRAFDFLKGPEKDGALIALAFGAGKDADPARLLVAQEALKRLGNFDPKKDAKYSKALDGLLERSKGTPQFVDLVNRFNISAKYPDLLDMAIADPAGQAGVDAIRILLGKNATELVTRALDGDEKRVAGIVEVLANSGENRAAGILASVVKDDDRSVELRRKAVKGLARSQNGGRELIRMAQKDELEAGLRTSAALDLHRSRAKDVRSAAAKLFPLPKTKSNRSLPSIAKLLGARGNVERGAAVFAKTGTCANCHKVNGAGKEVGPDMSEIGGKLTREALFESILFPSAAISHNFETYVVVLKNGETHSGILLSQTAAEVVIKGADALSRKFPKAQVLALKKDKLSMMPADLQKQMSAQELVDVVAYMTTLKKAKK